MSYLNGKFEFYDKAIEHAKSLNDKFWVLEEKVIPFLDRINSSEYIRTLYSKFGGWEEGQGYLYVCYMQEIEITLLESTILKLKEHFTCDEVPQLICELNEPILGKKDDINPNPSLLFINDPEYWNIKHIRFRLVDRSRFGSVEFWEVMTSELEKLTLEI